MKGLRVIDTYSGWSDEPPPWWDRRALAVGRDWLVSIRWPVYMWRPKHFVWTWAIWTGGRTAAFGPLVLYHYLDGHGAVEAERRP